MKGKKCSMIKDKNYNETISYKLNVVKCATLSKTIRTLNIKIKVLKLKKIYL